jgi:hypothetical protein
MKEQNEKQAIEEMAALMDGACDVIPLGECYTVDCNKCKAALLYNAGYRKQSVGEWVTVGEGITERVVCSNCNSEKGSFMKPPFCNQCGARMKGGAG